MASPFRSQRRPVLIQGTSTPTRRRADCARWQTRSGSITIALWNRPLFARIQARASATEERKGGAAHRRRLLAGLSGRVLEVGAGSGVNFAHDPRRDRGGRGRAGAEPPRAGGCGGPRRSGPGADRRRHGATPAAGGRVDGRRGRGRPAVQPARAGLGTGRAGQGPPRRRGASLLRARACARGRSRSSSACSTPRSGRASSAAAIPTATPRRRSPAPASPSRAAIGSRSTRRCWRSRSRRASSAAHDGGEPPARRRPGAGRVEGEDRPSPSAPGQPHRLERLERSVSDQ